MSGLLYSLSIVSIVAAGVVAKMAMDKDINLPLTLVWCLLGSGWGLLMVATILRGFEQ